MWRCATFLFHFCISVIIVSATETVEVNYGDEVHLMVNTIGSVVDGCFIVTPSGETVEFKPQNNSVEHRYILLDSNPMTECQVAVTIKDSDDNGEWSIYFTNEEKIINEVKTNVLVKTQDVAPSDSQDAIILLSGDVLPMMVNTIGIDFDGCAISTPQGEVIEFKPVDKSTDIRFKLLEDNKMSGCQVDITVSDEKDSGTWSIFVTKENNKVREEKNLISVETRDQEQITPEEEGDENVVEDIDDERYSITNNTPVTRIVHLGTTAQLDVQAGGKRLSFEECRIRDPTGSLVEDGRVGVTEVNTGTQISCRYLIGPLTESMLGEWTVILRYTNSGNFLEVRQIVDIIQEDPRNPVQDANRVIVDLDSLRFTGSIGLRHEVSIDGTSKIQIQSCHVRTPDGLQYMVMDGFNVPGVEAEVDSRICSMRIQILSDDMFGDWMLIARKSSYKQIPASEERLRVSITKESEEDARIVTTYLSRINYLVRPDMEVELSLGKLEHHVTCELRALSGDHGDNPKIRLLQSDDNPYAACRAIIGPIDDSLLGDYELCQKYQEINQEYADCLPATLTWNNDNPNSHWEIINQETFEHVVNYEGMISPGVTDSATLRTCHVITPNGNDIVVNGDSKYPYITRLTNNRCFVTIGPINNQVFGDWVVYGVYSSFQGVIVRRLPIHMSLYNPDDPYEQAYNVTNLNSVTRIVNLNTATNLEVTASVSSFTHNGCTLRGPDGNLFENNITGVAAVDIGSRLACNYRIDPITEKLLGEWTVSLKYRRNDQFTEVRQVFVIQREDPANPIMDDRPIDYLTPQHVTLRVGAAQQFSISGNKNRQIQSCHVRTPDNLQYTVMSGFHIPGVEAIVTNAICSVIIEAKSAAMIGDWVLIARKSQYKYSPASEERLNITIFIEDLIEAVPKEITVHERKTFTVRLAEPTNLYETCRLYGPDGIEYQLAEKDPKHTTECGFIVNEVTMNMNGTWQIVYGEGVNYSAYIEITVHATDDFDFPSLAWNVDDQFNDFIGPEKIIYCTLKDPQGTVIFDNFGRCRVDINRITHRHNGIWTATVGVAGKLSLTDHDFSVTVRGIQAESIPTVTTSVDTNSIGVDLSCSVITSTAMDVCKFLHSSGKVLIPTIGVTEDRYSASGNGSRVVPEGYENNCGIRITNPNEEDWGIWRCGISTGEKVVYGFLSVTNPDSIRTTEPELKVTHEVYRAIQGNEVTVSCNIMAPIHYCYFRNQNGTVFNLNPGSPSNDMEYIGAGFAAGECGMRFHSVAIGHSGQWSCNVGFADHFEEKRQNFQLIVSDHLIIEQFEDGTRLTIKTTFVDYSEQTASIEHCRYVRIDGLAFTSGKLPERYRTTISGNTCYLNIENPNILDHHPWAVTVRVRGHHEEYSGTSKTMLTFPEEVDVEEEKEEEENKPHPPVHYGGEPWLWMSFLFILIMIPIIAIMMTPRRREWTYNKYNTFRQSFRSQRAPMPLPLPITYNMYNHNNPNNQNIKQDEKTPYL